MSGVGYLGEIDVMEHLRKNLRHEVYIPLKDKGIDFVSVKKDKFYQIQVKTSMFHKNSFFWFDLHKKKLIVSPNTFYVFVCKSLSRRRFMNQKLNCFVVPSKELKKWITTGKMPMKKNSEEVHSLLIYPDFENKKWTHKNKGKTIDLMPYWNQFSFK